jgi:hypothetical protein
VRATLIEWAGLGWRTSKEGVRGADCRIQGKIVRRGQPAFQYVKELPPSQEYSHTIVAKSSSLGASERQDLNRFFAVFGGIDKFLLNARQNPFFNPERIDTFQPSNGVHLARDFFVLLDFLSFSCTGLAASFFSSLFI